MFVCPGGFEIRNNHGRKFRVYAGCANCILVLKDLNFSFDSVLFLSLFF